MPARVLNAKLCSGLVSRRVAAFAPRLAALVHEVSRSVSMHTPPEQTAIQPNSSSAHKQSAVQRAPSPLPRFLRREGAASSSSSSPRKDRSWM